MSPTHTFYKGDVPKLNEAALYWSPPKKKYLCSCILILKPCTKKKSMFMHLKFYRSLCLLLYMYMCVCAGVWVQMITYYSFVTAHIHISMFMHLNFYRSSCNKVLSLSLCLWVSTYRHVGANDYILFICEWERMPIWLIVVEKKGLRCN